MKKATKRAQKRYKTPYSCYLLYIFCSLRTYRYIKNYPIFKLLIDKYRKIRKLNHFLKYSLGGHRVDFGWTAEVFFKITNFSIFGVFLQKWTRDLKNGPLEAVMSKSKIQYSNRSLIKVLAKTMVMNIT